MAPLRIILQGDRVEAGALIPYARRKHDEMFAFMAGAGLVNFSKVIFTNVGTRIYLSYESTQGLIIIRTDGGLFYDFFTSEEISVAAGGPYTPPLPSPLAVDGQFHTATFKGGRIKRVEAGGTNYTAYPIPSSTVPTYRAWQRQKFHERAWYGVDGKTEMVMSAVGPRYENEFDKDSMLLTPVVRTRLVDADFDIPPTLYTKTSEVTAAPYFGDDLTLRTPDANGEDEYWRDACVRTVESQKFFFMADWYGEISMFKAVDGWPGTNPDMAVKKSIPWPSWVATDATVTNRLAANARWSFDQKGERAAIVVSERVNSQTGSGTDVYINTVGNVFWIEDPNQSVPPDVRAQEDLTGVVEISIEPTYDPQNDVFDFEIAVIREEQDDTKCYVVADYDFTTGKLVTAEVEAFAKSGVTGGPNYPEDFGISEMFYELVMYRHESDLTLTEKSELLRRVVYYAHALRGDRSATTVSGRSGTYAYQFLFDTNIANYTDGEVAEYLFQIRSMDLRAQALHGYEAIIQRLQSVFDIRGAKRFEAHGDVLREPITTEFIDSIPERTASFARTALTYYHDTRAIFWGKVWVPLVNQIQCHPQNKAWSVCGFNFQVGQGQWDPVLGFTDALYETRFDVVSVNGSRTTHKELFNRAHPDAPRDYDYWPVPDLGQMATAGIWRFF